MTQKNQMVHLTETPRDGMQALKQLIPTERKIEYINLLLRCGFNTVEVGSFVSPRAIPQMADIDEVLNGIDLSGSQSEIAVLIVTKKGIKRACEFEQIDKLFYPFSLSETFLKRNIKQTHEDAIRIIDELINFSVLYNKKPIVYYSWAFGDPYNDPWSLELLVKSIEEMASKGLSYFPLSDIAGEVSPQTISKVFKTLIETFPNLDFGFHLHALPQDRISKTEAAFNAGVKFFDSVIGGIGGCPMTGKELVANMDTETLLDFFNRKDVPVNVDRNCVEKAANFPLFK